MKKYIDARALRRGTAGCVALADVVMAGTTVYSMDGHERTPEYDALERANGLRFIFDIPWYVVPQLDVFAFDDGGWFGSLGGTADPESPWPVVYLRRDGSLLRVAGSLSDFLRLLQSGTDWRAVMVPEQTALVFPSRRAAKAALDFWESGLPAR